jgi:hypothetical protein
LGILILSCVKHLFPLYGDGLKPSKQYKIIIATISLQNDFDDLNDKNYLNVNLFDLEMKILLHSYAGVAELQ